MVRSASKRPRTALALHGWDAAAGASPNDLHFPAGAEIEIDSAQEPEVLKAGWIAGRLDGRAGILPLNRVAIQPEPGTTAAAASPTAPVAPESPRRPGSMPQAADALASVAGETDWRCPLCTLDNPAGAVTCVACESPRGRAHESPRGSRHVQADAAEVASLTADDGSERLYECITCMTDCPLIEMYTVENKQKPHTTGQCFWVTSSI